MQDSQILTSKYGALECFIQYLLSSSAKEQIARIILFGSVARGDANEESDVDVLVFGFGDMHKLSEECADASLETILESGELVQPLVYCISDLFPPGSYFLLKATQDGREIYRMDGNELKNKEIGGYLDLAQEYLEVAKNSLNDGCYRVAVDTAYTAAESCVRGLLLMKLSELPKSHRGLMAKFGELYIKNTELPKDIAKALNINLELRGKARYDAYILIDKGDAEDAIQLAEDLMKIFKDNYHECVI